MSQFLGVHVGRASLRARLLAEDGTPTALSEKLFRQPGDLTEALRSAVQELSSHPQWAGVRGAAVGLDKGQRGVLPAAGIQALLPDGVQLISLPAQLAILLGAVPSAPSLLVSLGSELRLAAMDSTNSYREFRLQEGGGLWWTGELARLAQHSPRLGRALEELPSQPKLLKALPRLLEMADYPAPDPVVKARVDGLCGTIAESCLGLSSRLPGITTMSMAGFLASGPLARRISEGCAGILAQRAPRFPAEVGAALLGLALVKENSEREHLGKPLESGQSPSDKWAAPPLLVRRLYRTRRPFDRFPQAATP